MPEWRGVSLGWERRAARYKCQPMQPVLMPPKRPFGFNVIGHFSAKGGLGIIARNVTKLVIAKGYPVAVYDIDQAARRADRDAEFQQYSVAEHKQLPYAINLNVLSITVLPKFMLDNPELLTDETLNVGFFWWEMSVLPAIWIEALQVYDVLVAGSDFIRATFDLNLPATLSVSASPVLSLPAEIPSSSAHSKRETGSIAFICIVEPTSDPERKNPFAAIDAFHRAFGDDPRPRLIVKFNSARLAEVPDHVYQKIRACCASDSRIQLIEGNLTYPEVLSLYASCDVFVALHRSEGLGLGLMEAMALGKPVIATAWSGNMTFMNHTNACLVRYRLVPVSGTLPVYRKEFLGRDAMWAEPDLVEAANWMRTLAEDPNLRSAIGAKAANDMQKLEQRGQEAAYLDELRALWQYRESAIGSPSVRRPNLNRLQQMLREQHASPPHLIFHSIQRFLERHLLWRFRPLRR